MVKQLENFNTEEDLLIKYLEVIGNDRIIIEDYEIVNIWDKQESPAQYSIYYTQRVIESLVKLYSVLYPSRKVDAYFEKSQIKQQGDESLVPMSTQAVQITIDGDWIKEKAVVIDVGIGELAGKIAGDVEFDQACKRASFITPVPGGVGKLTTLFLFENLLRAINL